LIVVGVEIMDSDPEQSGDGRSLGVYWWIENVFLVFYIGEAVLRVMGFRSTVQKRDEEVSKTATRRSVWQRAETITEFVTDAPQTPGSQRRGGLFVLPEGLVESEEDDSGHAIRVDNSGKRLLDRCIRKAMEGVQNVQATAQGIIADGNRNAVLTVRKQLQKKLVAVHTAAADMRNWQDQLTEEVLRYWKAEVWGQAVWLVFDISIVVVSIVDVWVFAMMDSKSKGFGILRTLRLLRVVRSVKLLRYFKELYLIVMGLYHAFFVLFWIVFLLFLFIYVCATFCVNLIGDEGTGFTEEGRRYFESLPMAIFTLFEVMTLENWTEVSETYKRGQDYSVAVLVFLMIFIFMTHFTVLNLFVAAIVEHIQRESSTADLELMNDVRENHFRIYNLLWAFFELADENGDGELSIAEFKEVLQNPEAEQTLQALGLAAHDIEWLFDILDVDGNGVLNIDEFISGCLDSKSSEQSRMLLRLQYTLVKEIRSVLKPQLEQLDRALMNDAAALSSPNPDFLNGSDAGGDQVTRLIVEGMHGVLAQVNGLVAGQTAISSGLDSLCDEVTEVQGVQDQLQAQVAQVQQDAVFLSSVATVCTSYK